MARQSPTLLFPSLLSLLALVCILQSCAGVEEMSEGFMPRCKHSSFCVCAMPAERGPGASVQLEAWDVLLTWDLPVSWDCVNGTSLHQRTSQRARPELYGNHVVPASSFQECSQSKGSVWGQCWHLHAGCSSVAPCAEPSACWSVEGSSCSVWACLYTNPAFSAGSCCLCSAAALDTVRAGLGLEEEYCSCTPAET